MENNLSVYLFAFFQNYIIVFIHISLLRNDKSITNFGIVSFYFLFLYFVSFSKPVLSRRIPTVLPHVKAPSPHGDDVHGHHFGVGVTLVVVVLVAVNLETNQIVHFR